MLLCHHLALFSLANSAPRFEGGWPCECLEFGAASSAVLASASKEGSTVVRFLGSFRHLPWLLLAASLIGCASTSAPPAPALAAIAEYTYVIGPGDSLNIVVWRNPELSMSEPVRPDG